MENITTAERNVVEVNGVTVDLDVIGKDAELEMNNNNNNEGLMALKHDGSIAGAKDSAMSTNEEPTTVAEERKSENVTDEMAKNESEHNESDKSGSTNTDNGNAEIDKENEPTEGDLKVEERASTPEMNDEKTESSEPSEPSEQTEASEPSESSEPSSYTADTESKDTYIASESGMSENVTENNADNAIESSNEKEVASSEQSGYKEPQKEATEEKRNDKEEEEEEKGTVTAAAEKNDDAQTEVETVQKEGDDANETVKNDSPKRSPRKKSSNKKRKNRSQKKQPDYSDLVKYTVSVSQRQRRYSLHVPRGRVIDAPADDCEIFCSNIPINVLEGELIPLFERYGKIWELRLMMSMRNPKRNAGFAFVRYTSNESATQATEKLNNYEILPGKLLAIRLSQPNLSLFVGNIHRGLTREQIHEKISNRTAGLVKTFVKTSLYEDTKNCGFCFLEYDSHSAALKAKKLLNQGNVWGRQLFVDWAQRRQQMDDNDLNESKTLFINNLPKETTDELITEALGSYGTIEKITKIKDYAFVLFEEHQSAENALNGVDKMKLGNDKVEVSMAMPKSMKSRPRFATHPSYRHNSYNQRRSGRSRGNNHFKQFNTSFGSSASSNKFYMRKQHKPKKAASGSNNDATGTTVEQTTIIPMPVNTDSAPEILAN